MSKGMKSARQSHSARAAGARVAMTEAQRLIAEAESVIDSASATVVEEIEPVIDRLEEVAAEAQAEVAIEAPRVKRALGARVKGAFLTAAAAVKKAAAAAVKWLASHYLEVSTVTAVVSTAVTCFYLGAQTYSLFKAVSDEVALAAIAAATPQRVMTVGHFAVIRA